MIYKSQNVDALSGLINEIKGKTFDINTQYKFLKISKALQEEISIITEQKEFLLQSYADKDANGKLIFSPDGGIKIKEDCLLACADKINEINNRQITLPDIYFSLDELEPLGLTLGELELLDPFIK